MAEINTAGYQKIRDFIQANWKYMELRDGLNNPVLRIGIGDSRVNWTHNPGDQTLELTVIVKGSDVDIVEPVTLGASAIFDVASGGSAYSEESFTTFTIQAAEDQLTIKHRIQVPQVV